MKLAQQTFKSSSSPAQNTTTCRKSSPNLVGRIILKTITEQFRGFNSGTIKLTDFYGKEHPPTGSPPAGVYDGYPFKTESWRPSGPNYPVLSLWTLCLLVTYGDPYVLPNTAGVVGSNQYGDYSEVISGKRS